MFILGFIYRVNVLLAENYVPVHRLVIWRNLDNYETIKKYAFKLCLYIINILILLDIKHKRNYILLIILMLVKGYYAIGIKNLE